MDKTALHKLSYGLYVVTTEFEGRMNGQIVDAIVQINAAPTQTVAVSLNNDNFTNELVKKSGKLAISVLSTAYDMDIIANFGFKSGRDFDKFAAYPPKISSMGLPYYDGKAFCAWLEGKVISSMEVGSHTIFVVEVSEAVKGEGAPLIYADYINRKAAPAPVAEAPKADEPKKGGMRCKICGYIEYGEMGQDYRCPICGVGPEQFEPVE
jgi:flavin reductase (DIM6/NTAB) family NADH-FMN oxidoreductase RutF/rubredoxin